MAHRHAGADLQHSGGAAASGILLASGGFCLLAGCLGRGILPAGALWRDSRLEQLSAETRAGLGSRCLRAVRTRVRDDCRHGSACHRDRFCRRIGACDFSGTCRGSGPDLLPGLRDGRAWTELDRCVLSRDHLEQRADRSVPVSAAVLRRCLDDLSACLPNP